MQPYVFPYAGYFQLLHASDKFVVYDDVNFIKGGWINRNRILLEGKDFLFTLPLQDASPFKKINEVSVHPRLYGEWRAKFYKSLKGVYAKAPFFEPVFSLVQSVLEKDTASISIIATDGLKAVKDYLNLPAEIVSTSAVYQNAHLSGKERVMDICLKENARTYVNAPGGRQLYTKEFFKAQDIELYFIQSGSIDYKQFQNDFVPGLSILDLLMFNSPTEANQLLARYSLQ